jgi:hypothetical protein
LKEFFDGICLFLRLLAGVIFGYFLKLFGQIALSIAVELWLEAVFAEVFDNVLFAKLKIQIHKRHHQRFETDEQKQKKCYVAFVIHGMSK